jgi:hypothetical protein
MNSHKLRLLDIPPYIYHKYCDIHVFLIKVVLSSIIIGNSAPVTLTNLT